MTTIDASAKSPTPGDAGFLILYVADPRASAAFWSRLTGRPVLEEADTFAMLGLREGVMLGLWRREGVVPAASASGGGMEICWPVGSAEVVDATHARWAAMGLTILQSPCEMDFGRTFTAADPDGHRLRVFCPAG
ncbi:MAG: VOC family protein [Siculibacillus sp.]